MREEERERQVCMPREKRCDPYFQFQRDLWIVNDGA